MNEHVALTAREAGYDADFFEWTVRQTDLLRSGRLDLLDVDNLAEEIESLGNSDRRGAVSHMAVLIEHLLKLRFSADVEPRQVWRRSVGNARVAVDLIFDDSPSLRGRRKDLFDKAWRFGLSKARNGVTPAEAKTLANVAASPLFTVDEALDPDFFFEA